MTWVSMNSSKDSSLGQCQSSLRALLTIGLDSKAGSSANCSRDLERVASRLERAIQGGNSKLPYSSILSTSSLAEMTLLFTSLRAVSRSIQRRMWCSKITRLLNTLRTTYSSCWERRTCPLIDGSWSVQSAQAVRSTRILLELLHGILLSRDIKGGFWFLLDQA